MIDSLIYIAFGAIFVVWGAVILYVLTRKDD